MNEKEIDKKINELEHRIEKLEEKLRHAGEELNPECDDGDCL